MHLYASEYPPDHDIDPTLHQAWQIRRACESLGIDAEQAEDMTAACETREDADDLIRDLCRRLADAVRGL